jgi:hypothetical protein
MVDHCDSLVAAREFTVGDIDISGGNIDVETRG